MYNNNIYIINSIKWINCLNLEISNYKGPISDSTTTHLEQSAQGPNSGHQAKARFEQSSDR